MGTIHVALVDEHGDELAVVEGDTHLLDPLLPRFQSDQFHCLAFIDPYGDTVFNRLQLRRLISEWVAVQREASDEPTRNLVEEVAGLIHRGANEPHTYLKFIGD